MTLALRTGISPTAWEAAGSAAVATALELLAGDDSPDGQEEVQPQ